jgi:hypothetical protein
MAKVRFNSTRSVHRKILEAYLHQKLPMLKKKDSTREGYTFLASLLA